MGKVIIGVVIVAFIALIAIQIYDPSILPFIEGKIGSGQ